MLIPGRVVQDIQISNPVRNILQIDIFKHTSIGWYGPVSFNNFNKKYFFFYFRAEIAKETQKTDIMIHFFKKVTFAW